MDAKVSEDGDHGSEDKADQASVSKDDAKDGSQSMPTKRRARPAKPKANKQG